MTCVLAATSIFAGFVTLPFYMENRLKCVKYMYLTYLGGVFFLFSFVVFYFD